MLRCSVRWWAGRRRAGRRWTGCRGSRGWAGWWWTSRGIGRRWACTNAGVGVDHQIISRVRELGRFLSEEVDICQQQHLLRREEALRPVLDLAVREEENRGKTHYLEDKIERRSRTGEGSGLASGLLERHKHLPNLAASSTRGKSAASVKYVSAPSGNTSDEAVPSFQTKPSVQSTLGLEGVVICVYSRKCRCQPQAFAYLSLPVIPWTTYQVFFKEALLHFQTEPHPKLECSHDQSTAIFSLPVAIADLTE